VCQIGFAGRLRADVAELEGTNPPGQGGFALLLHLAGGMRSGRFKANAQGAIVQRTSSWRGHEVQAGYFALPILDAIHQLAKRCSRSLGIVEQNPQLLVGLVLLHFQGAIPNVRKPHL
jgi:hypothetical protein